MKKILGYCEMKKTKGKVVFVEDNENRENIVGTSCDRIFIYGDVSDKVKADSIGKHLELQYDCGYNGKAYISNVNIK